jgi:hypothetical protein
MQQQLSSPVDEQTVKETSNRHSPQSLKISEKKRKWDHLPFMVKKLTT